MKAVRYDEYGATPILVDIPAPDCPAGGVLIEVRATGVCHSDWHARQAHDPVTVPFVCGCGCGCGRCDCRWAWWSPRSSRSTARTGWPRDYPVMLGRVASAAPGVTVVQLDPVD